MNKNFLMMTTALVLNTTVALADQPVSPPQVTQVGQSASGFTEERTTWTNGRTNYYVTCFVDYNVFKSICAKQEGRNVTWAGSYGQNFVYKLKFRSEQEAKTWMMQGHAQQMMPYQNPRPAQVIVVPQQQQQYQQPQYQQQYNGGYQQPQQYQQPQMQWPSQNYQQQYQQPQQQYNGYNNGYQQQNYQQQQMMREQQQRQQQYGQIIGGVAQQQISTMYPQSGMGNVVGAAVQLYNVR